MQKYWSVLFGAVMFGALLLFVVSPFVGWWLPKNVASFGGEIDGLFWVILIVTGIFFVLTEFILVYNLWHFGYKPGHKSQYVHTNHKLETVWTIVPGVLLAVLALVQISVWAKVKFIKSMPPANGEKTQQLEVTARQWEWLVRYPSSKAMADWEKDPKLADGFDKKPGIDDVHLPNEVHVWQGAQVLVHLKTTDVIHSFFLPNLRLKQDALPGKTIPVWFAVNDDYNTELQSDPATGEKYWIEKGLDRKTNTAKDPKNPPQVWELACAEFCGTRHSMMRGKLYVHKDKADFLAWLQHAEEEQSRHKNQMASTVAAR